MPWCEQGSGRAQRRCEVKLRPGSVMGSDVSPCRSVAKALTGPWSWRTSTCCDGWGRTPSAPATTPTPRRSWTCAMPTASWWSTSVREWALKYRKQLLERPFPFFLCSSELLQKCPPPIHSARCPDNGRTLLYLEISPLRHMGPVRLANRRAFCHMAIVSLGLAQLMSPNLDPEAGSALGRSHIQCQGSAVLIHPRGLSFHKERKKGTDFIPSPGLMSFCL